MDVMPPKVAPTPAQRSPTPRVGSIPASTFHRYSDRAVVAPLSPSVSSATRRLAGTFAEDLRVLSYQRLQNLVALVATAAYFASTFLGQKMRLRLITEKLLIISARFFGIPLFSFYAFAEGIRKVLSQGRPPVPHPPTLGPCNSSWHGTHKKMRKLLLRFLLDKPVPLS